MMKNQLKYFAIVVLGLALVVSGCQRPQKITAPKARESAMAFATLYNYYSAEYKALAIQAYNIASQRLVEIRNHDPYNDSLAVILDLDETVLDNSPYQARLIIDNIQYDSLWNEWCKLAEARAVPGSADFIKLADSLGYKIYYLSNRKEKTTAEATMKNLEKLGLPQVKNENMLLRTTTSNKQSRRNQILEKNQIALLIGDNLGDFFEDAVAAGERDEQVISYAQEFGDRFIILPNAMYGNWLQSLGIKEDPMSYAKLLEDMLGNFR